MERRGNSKTIHAKRTRCNIYEIRDAILHVACDLPADKGLLNYYVSIRRGIFHLSCTLGACTTRREQRTKEISRSGRGPRASRSAGSEFRVGDCIARVDRSIRLTTARVTRGRHFYKFFPRLVILLPLRSKINR